MKSIELNESLRGRVVYVLILVGIIQTTYPITVNASTLVLILFQTLYLVMIVVGILVSRESPQAVRWMIFLAICWGISGPAYALFPDSALAFLGAYVTIAAYQAMVAWVLLIFVFRARVVDRDVIYAAATVYLLIGAVFVGIFGSIEVLTYAHNGTHAFSDGLVAADEVFPWQNLVYYSYVTLTTLGYGDVLPVTPWARSLAALEAIIGVMYVTIIMARLVGVYAAQETEELLEAESP